MHPRLPFVALDFETADPHRDSACRVALVRVENGRIIRELDRLVRPPRSEVWFTDVHGLTWNDLRSAPDFAGVWTELAPALDGAAFLVAHNAPFDKSVLEASLGAYGMRAPNLPFECTLALARRRWGLRPARLPDVCAHLGIQLGRHHDALDDARACARIALAAGLDLPAR